MDSHGKSTRNLKFGNYENDSEKINTYSSVWIKIRLRIQTVEINCNNSHMQILTSNSSCAPPATFLGSGILPNQGSRHDRLRD